MTIEEFSRTRDVPASTVRKVIGLQNADSLSEIGVERVHGQRGRYAIRDSRALCLAVAAHVGPRFLNREAVSWLLSAAEYAARPTSGYSAEQRTRLEYYRDLLKAILQSAF